MVARPGRRTPRALLPWIRRRTAGNAWRMGVEAAARSNWQARANRRHIAHIAPLLRDRPQLAHTVGMTTTNPPEELTIANAAEKYGVNRRTLQRATERGTIPSRMVDGRYYVDGEAVRLFGEIGKARDALSAYTGRSAGDA